METERSDGHWLDEHPGFPLAFGFAPTLAAMLVFQLFGAVNLFWSSVFGLGGWTLHWLLPAAPGAFMLFGILGWPAIVWIALHRLGETIGRLPAPRRAAAMCAYGASLCLAVPINRLGDLPDLHGFRWSDLPLYFGLWTY